MEYYSSEELDTIKEEINTLLANGVNKEIKRIKNTAEFKRTITDKYSLLAICQEIISAYKPVTEETDGIINNITETDLQTIVIKIYEHFFPLKYPK